MRYHQGRSSRTKRSKQAKMGKDKAKAPPQEQGNMSLVLYADQPMHMRCKLGFCRGKSRMIVAQLIATPDHHHKVEAHITP